MISLCDGWEFTREWSEAFLNWEAPGEAVRLPHTAGEVPLHYAHPNNYGGICGYRRKLELEPDWVGRRLFIQFDGAAHIARVYVNGKMATEHRCGYTAFRVELTELISAGENRIAVELDCSENPDIPPFGFVVDYLCYGGLYREVWLDIREQSCIEDVFITTPTVNSANVKVKFNGEDRRLRVRITDGGRLMAEAEGEGDFDISVPDALPWDVDSPKLYTCVVQLLDGDRVADEKRTDFGFRTAVFKSDGLYLNGKRIFMRGLNRHQCYPYMGYAAAESLQREDARILKRELGCNAVRTSHYPQSQYFIDECDRIGLLVFTELPGWQHIGAERWKDQAVENVREMVLQYRNHPSIILWGVRINESMDDDGLYTRTNAAAKELDPSRATSGVRFIEKSNLLEDVYSYNDFSHNGGNPGVKTKKSVTPDTGKALIVSEHNGHMFPTKAFDTWQKRQEQALRHARVLNDAAADGGHGGCFGWCMFDYPTHKDFGSGDRVCYHGVMDAFRNPKTAAALYASQDDKTPVLEVGSPMDIGDYSAGNLGDIYVFTNCDEVELYKNDDFVTRFSPSGWTGLPHGPIGVDDTIGSLLETKEGFEPKKAALLRESLAAAGKYGLAAMPLKYKLKLLRCMLRYHMTMADGVALYGRYVGNWGGEATRWRFDGVKDGMVAVSSTRCPSERLHIEARPSSIRLHEGDSYDMAAVRIRIMDEFDNVASYAQLPVSFRLSGPVELVGPETVTAEGGMCGCYVKTTGKAGKAELIISTGQTQTVIIEFEVEI